MGPPVLKKPTVAFVGFGRLIGIKPEVIQRAKANRVGVLILRKRFRVPRYRTGRPDTLHGVLLYPVFSWVPSFAQPGS